MTRTVIAFAGALALAASATRATDDKPQSASAKTASKAEMGTTTASTDSQVSGDVKSTDPMAMIITVVLPTGDEQRLDVGSDAQINRDGSTASIAQVQPGDNVRASFDPKTHKASQIDVKSKGAADSKDTSSDSKDKSSLKDNSPQTNPDQKK